ncbi:hypothetical protein Taro_024906 [Colocasia esculenta]|uniref:SAM-dependent methyltransferase TRM5/TYW2-type domain-containing protein n=1 Tax=Colocasia esculenta TaxID=4460 RepID=A0A843VIW1_COLES|nr:hypothetical protein [Colocasia esculenta]
MASPLSLLRLHAAPFLSTSTALLPARRHPSLLPVFSTLSSASLTLNPADHLAASYPYGPSIRKGLPRPPRPPPGGDDDDGAVDCPGAALDRERFVRVFEVAALRVPAAGCAALEGRLRGHLLNWPRVRNVARVPGDEVDPEVAGLLREGGGGGRGDRLEAALRRAPGEDDGEGDGEVAAMSPVLYREKLVKEFNCRGFVRFRNLAKMSRPKKKKKKNKGKEEEDEEREEGEARSRRGKSDFSIVEVVRGCSGEDKEEGLGRLLGDDFARGRWTGATRLLLLDERYANKGVEELPEAVKAILHGYVALDMPSKCELVQCRLTLFYDYWSMNEILEELLPNGVIVPTAFETVGHIAHLNLRDEHLPYKKLIAQVVLDKNKPKIETVVNKIDAIQNDYRTMQLEVLSGNHSLVTTVVENGIRFHVNLARVYWNSRLATERQRLICSFTGNDVVCDVFAGVGPIAISAAKKVKHVYANDLNPNAIEYLERNIVLNKLERKIEVIY